MFALIASAAEHPETSKTAFYVTGCALAAWAVILSAYGLKKPDFPSPGAARGVMAITAVLMGAALVAAVATG
jgi:hypothetical protein